MTDAHYQKFALSQTPLTLWIPEHEPREKDPHYHIFNAAKKKLHELDSPCWRCGVTFSQLKAAPGVVSKVNPFGAKQNEIHHDVVEFSTANAVDVDKFVKLYPEFNVHNQEEFLAFVESEGNLLVLCDVCHRSPHLGIHMTPYPLWKMAPIWRDDLPPFMGNSPH